MAKVYQRKIKIIRNNKRRIRIIKVRKRRK